MSSDHGKHVKQGRWSQAEDDKLKLVTTVIRVHGGVHDHWSLVTELSGLKRNKKARRDRWTRHLDPSINKEEFSVAEACTIISHYELLKTKNWAELAKILPGRTDLDVRNFYNSNYGKNLMLSCMKSLAGSSFNARGENSSISHAASNASQVQEPSHEYSFPLICEIFSQPCSSLDHLMINQAYTNAPTNNPRLQEIDYSTYLHLLNQDIPGIMTEDCTYAFPNNQASTSATSNSLLLQEKYYSIYIDLLSQVIPCSPMTEDFTYACPNNQASTSATTTSLRPPQYSGGGVPAVPPSYQLPCSSLNHHQCTPK